MKQYIKHFLLGSIFSLIALSGMAVEFNISDGVANEAVKNKMTTTLSNIFTEINLAYNENREPVYGKMNIGPKGTSAEETISFLWSNTPFYCIDDVVVEKGLQTASGKYQVRNIPLLLKNVEEGSDDYQEGVATFDRNGNLEEFNLAIAQNIYGDIITQKKDVTDLRHREMILDWTERFRTAYNTKDSVFIKNVFSDDALIITGKVTTKAAKSGDALKIKGDVQYFVQNKKEYIARLKKVFDNNKFINVTFNDIKVFSHPNAGNEKYKDYYGVTLQQDYKSSGYSDEGYLFLMWDFRNEEKPQIHVRVWQPNDFDEGGDGPFEFVDL